VVGYSDESSEEDCGAVAESDALDADGVGARCGYAAWKSASGCGSVCASEDVEGAIGVDVGVFDVDGIEGLSFAGALEDQSQPIVAVEKGFEIEFAYVRN
jgi:hypothetical protein